MIQEQPALQSSSFRATIKIARLIQRIRKCFTARLERKSLSSLSVVVIQLYCFYFSALNPLNSFFEPQRHTTNKDEESIKDVSEQTLSRKQAEDFFSLPRKIDCHAKHGDLCLSAVASRDRLLRRHDIRLKSSISIYHGLYHALEFVFTSLVIAQRSCELDCNQWKFVSGLRSYDRIAGYNLPANLKHLILCLQCITLQISKPFDVNSAEADDHRWYPHWQHRKRLDEGWFSEWPSGHRPLHTSWPWNIRPSLVVLWGVCWMFFDHNMPEPRVSAEGSVGQQAVQATSQRRYQERHNLPRSTIPFNSERKCSFGTESSMQHNLQNPMGLCPDGTQQFSQYATEQSCVQDSARARSSTLPNSAQNLDSFVLQQRSSPHRLGDQGNIYSPNSFHFEYQNETHHNPPQRRPQKMWSPALSFGAGIVGEGTGSEATSAALAQPSSIKVPGRGQRGNSGICNKILPPKGNREVSLGNPYIISNSTFPSIPSTASTCSWSESPGVSTWSQDYRPPYENWQPALTEPQVPPQSLLATNEIVGITPYVATYPSTGTSYPISSSWAPRQDYSLADSLGLGLMLAMQDPQTYPSPHSEDSGRASSLCPTLSTPNQSPAVRLEVSPNSIRILETRGDRMQSLEPLRNSEGQMYCDHPNCAHKSRVFARKCEWTKHMDKHTRPHKCNEPGCEKIEGFTYSGGLLRHQREVHKQHGGPKAPRMCPHPDCKRSTAGFSRKENLYEHLRRVHRGVGAPPPSADLPIPTTAPDPTTVQGLGLPSQPTTVPRKRRRGQLGDGSMREDADFHEPGDLREQVKKLKREADKKDERLRKLETLVRNVIQGQQITLENV